MNFLAKCVQIWLSNLINFNLITEYYKSKCEFACQNSYLLNLILFQSCHINLVLLWILTSWLCFAVPADLESVFNILKGESRFRLLIS